MEAAYTKPGGSCPGYINVKEIEGGGVKITVRADPVNGECGQTVSLEMSGEEWRKWVESTEAIGF